MGLSDIAAEAGTTTTEQRDRGVAAVDDTERSLSCQLGEYAAALPCTPGEAAAVLREHVAGAPVEASAREAGVPPVTAAKTLHLLGVEGVCPLAPTARQVVADWTRGEVSRSDAVELTGASDAEFALAAFVETHDPLEGARGVVERVREHEGDAMVAKRDALADAMADATDLA